MQDQNNQEQSYISLSAFLSLDKCNKDPQIDASKFILTADDIQNNGIFSSNGYDHEYNSKENSDDHQNQQEQKKQKEKKEIKNYSKNYRKRHKDYVESLKAINIKYQKKIEQLTLKIDQMTQQIKCLKYGRQLSDNMFDSMFLKEKQESLKQLVNQSQKNKPSSWEKVRQFASVYGFAGRQKINLLNYYMSQIIDNLIIDHHKNFVLSGLQQFEITSSWAKTIYQKQAEICQIDANTFTNLKKHFKKNMVQTLKNFHKSGQQFYQSYIKLIGQAIEIQSQFQHIKDGVTKLIDPQKFLTLLKWYEQNKYCKQIQIIRKQWYQSFRKN